MLAVAQLFGLGLKAIDGMEEARLRNQTRVSKDTMSISKHFGL
jgi:hypothetical protein